MNVHERAREILDVSGITPKGQEYRLVIWADTGSMGASSDFQQVPMIWSRCWLDHSPKEICRHTGKNIPRVWVEVGRILKSIKDLRVEKNYSPVKLA